MANNSYIYIEENYLLQGLELGTCPVTIYTERNLKLKISTKSYCILIDEARFEVYVEGSARGESQP